MTNPILLGPRALLGSLVSFETLLVLYVFAGVYKGDPRFAWIPVDLTGLFFALSVVVGSFIIVRSPIYKKGLPVVFAMICLVTWLWVSLAWSPSQVYGPDKVFLMATLALWAVIAGALIIAPNPERLRRLFTLLLLFAVWIGVEAVLAYSETGGEVGRLERYLLMGRVCGLGALTALAGWLYSTDRVAGWFSMGLFLVLGFVLAVAGGRGPLLATVVPLLIPVGLSIRLTARRILYSRILLSVVVLPLVMAAGLAVYTIVTDQRLGTIERLAQLTTDDIGNSAQTRADHYATTGKLWPQAPLLGHGAGSWPLLTGRPDIPIYPHNLFMELLVEGGLIALTLFCALLGTVLRPASFARMRRDPQALCATMLFANTFFNAMTTGDLADNRPIFMMIGVLALFAVRPVATATTAVALDRGQPPVGAGSPAPGDWSEPAARQR